MNVSTHLKFRYPENKRLFEYYHSIGYTLNDSIALAIYTYGDYENGKTLRNSLYGIANKYYSIGEDRRGNIAYYIGNMIASVVERNPNVYVEDALALSDEYAEWLADGSKSYISLNADMYDYKQDHKEIGLSLYKTDIFNTNIVYSLNQHVVLIVEKYDKYIQAGILTILKQLNKRCDRENMKVDTISLLVFGGYSEAYNIEIQSYKNVDEFINKLFQVGSTKHVIDYSEELYKIIRASSLKYVLNPYAVHIVLFVDTHKIREEYSTFIQRVCSEYSQQIGVVITEVDCNKDSLENLDLDIINKEIDSKESDKPKESKNMLKRFINRFL